MGARILNFPLNRILPANKSSLSGLGKTGPVEQSAPEARKNREIKTLCEILRDEELSKEMFSPDYFMLVE